MTDAATRASDVTPTNTRRKRDGVPLRIEDGKVPTTVFQLLGHDQYASVGAVARDLVHASHHDAVVEPRQQRGRLARHRRRSTRQDQGGLNGDAGPPSPGDVPFGRGRPVRDDRVRNSPLAERLHSTQRGSSPSNRLRAGNERPTGSSDTRRRDLADNRKPELEAWLRNENATWADRTRKERIESRQRKVRRRESRHSSTSDRESGPGAESHGAIGKPARRTRREHSNTRERGSGSAASSRAQHRMLSKSGKRRPGARGSSQAAARRRSTSRQMHA